MYHATLGWRVIKKRRIESDRGADRSGRAAIDPVHTHLASKRRRDNLQGFKDFCLKAKALTVIYVPYSLDSGVGGRGGSTLALPRLGGRCGTCEPLPRKRGGC